MRFSPSGSVVVSGRSDATLNRGGVRLGTAEFYRVVEELPEIADSLVVHLEDPAGGTGELMLFVVPAAGRPSTTRSSPDRPRAALGTLPAPRARPVVAVPAVPRTRTGKKLEVPAKRILQGRPGRRSRRGTRCVDPQALDAFVAYAAARGGETDQTTHEDRR